MKALSDFDNETLRAQFERWGCPASHADRLLSSYYNSGGLVDLAELKLGKALTAKIEREIALRQSKVLTKSASIDGTVKLLLGMKLGGAVETVLMTTNIPDRAAGCVSSQIGCAMGCDFCASTKGGLERNLGAGEIVEQFLHLRENAIATNRRLTTLVFMGMGEPLQNYDNVIAAVKRIADNKLGGLGWRQITVSTVGIVPEMHRLADENLNINLALSLHAPDDETRSKIVPMNKRYPVKEIIDATKRFFELTGRITNVEYCMLAGVNDSDEHARMLADLLKGFRTHVNLIPFNAIGSSLNGVVYQRPSDERLENFISILKSGGVVTHFRKTRGDDVNAACGQLRERELHL